MLRGLLARRRAERWLDRALQLYGDYARTGDVAALSGSAAALRRAVAAAPDGDPLHSLVHTALASVLSDLFSATGSLDTLRDAVEVGRAAVAATPAGRPHHGRSLQTLSSILLSSFGRTGDVASLTEAVELGRRAVAAAPVGHPEHESLVAGLAGCLLTSYERTGDLPTLREAIELGRYVVARARDDGPDRSVLNNLGLALLKLFERTGDLAALVETVGFSRAAVAATPRGHPDEGSYLSNACLSTRLLFEETGELAALAESIGFGRESVARTPPDSPRLAERLGNLGAVLHLEFRRTRDHAALVDAVEVSWQAAAAAPVDHPVRPHWLNNVGSVLQDVFHRTGEPTPLAYAADFLREAVTVTPADDPKRSMWSANLASVLQIQFRQSRDPAVLREAVNALEEAVATSADGSSEHARYLMLLGRVLLAWFEHTGDPAVLDTARDAFAAAATAPTASPTVRIDAGRGAASAALLADEPKAAVAAFEAVIALLPRFVPGVMARADREHGLGRLAGLASEVAAAAVTAGRPDQALVLLEQTRGLLVGDAIDARSDLTGLRLVAPGLAAEFDELREQITALGDVAVSGAAPSTPTDATRLGRRRQELDARWTDVLGRIRATTGFAEFLRPPAIDLLPELAAGGPIIVVYASRRRADALVVTDDREAPVTVVPLPDLTDDAVGDQVNRLYEAVRERSQDEVHAVLRWAWDTIAGPVFDHLRIDGGPGPRPRIWWCPVGLLAYLPLHAAGHHHDVLTSPTPRTVLDRSVASYTATLRSLQHVRADRGESSGSTGSALLVAMPTTPDEPDLPGAHDEVRALARLLNSPLVLTGAAATHEAVVAALPRHRIAHFACHGLSAWVDPAAGRLLLHDHAAAPLTITSLLRLRLHDADLAYLSACSTTQASRDLADEAVHLTAAVQLAGYRCVVGTMWTIHDSAAKHIATGVYARLTADGTRAPRTEGSAAALADAVRAERNAYLDFPTRWAAHVVFGP